MRQEWQEAECEAAKRREWWFSKDTPRAVRKTLRHMPRDHVGNTVPSVYCTCGFYAWKTEQQATWYAMEHSGFAYPALLKGIVIEHENGYRAQYMKYERTT